MRRNIKYDVRAGLRIPPISISPIPSTTTVPNFNFTNIQFPSTTNSNNSSNSTFSSSNSNYLKPIELPPLFENISKDIT